MAENIALEREDFWSNNPCDGDSFTHIVLPGVGSFDDFMFRLENSGFDMFLRRIHNDASAAILGVCIGMHIMSDRSDDGEKKGLGLIPGEVLRIPGIVVTPHMGWNSIEQMSETSLLESVDLEKGFYYLHNYMFRCANNDDVIAIAGYNVEIESIVMKNRTIGVQFHPEKSHANGIKLFSNFLGM